MSFFYSSVKKQADESRGLRSSGGRRAKVSDETLKDMGCKACPLDKQARRLVHPKMQPTGAENPSLYILATSPTERDDEVGELCSGKSGDLLRQYLPDGSWLRSNVRWNSIVGCHPPSGRDPSKEEVMCCSGYLEQDIERTKPKIILGLGVVPLRYFFSNIAPKQPVVADWRGRYIPVRVGNHVCWYFPTFDPIEILSSRNKWGESKLDPFFRTDLNRIVSDLRKGVDPITEYHSGDFDTGIVSITGEGGYQDLVRLEEQFHILVQEDEIAFDIETTRLDPYRTDSRWVSASFGTFEHSVAYPFDHPYCKWNPTQQRKVRGMTLEFILSSGRKVAHNLGFEMKWVAEVFDPKVLRRTEWGDTLLLAHALREKLGVKNLGTQTIFRFGFNVKSLNDIDFKKILQVPIGDLLVYNGMDSKWEDLLMRSLRREADANDPSSWVEYDRLIRTAPTLVIASRRGVRLDADHCDSIIDTVTGDLNTAVESLRKCEEVRKYEDRRGEFNPGSPAHVQTLYSEIAPRDEIALPDGGYSTSEESISQIPLPSAKLILEYRTLSKLLSTYLVGVKDQFLYPGDFLHPSYNSDISRTGRLSAQDPNIQNFPKRKHRYVRRMIVSRYSNGTILSADYGQIEARVIAMASCDPKFCEALWKGLDIHMDWSERIVGEHRDLFYRTAEIYSMDDGDFKGVMKKVRDRIKNQWVFPQFFGSSTRTCAKLLELPEGLGSDLGNEFWREFEGVAAWQKELQDRYQRDGYVFTLTGRKLLGPLGWNDLINYPIQGTASDICVDSMNRLSERADMEDDELLIAPVNVHDDLTFDLPNDAVDEYQRIIGHEMSRPVFDFINVPLIVEIEAGPTWCDQKALAEYSSESEGFMKNPFH